jgi:hypothetical protein
MFTNYTCPEKRVPNYSSDDGDIDHNACVYNMESSNQVVSLGDHLTSTMPSEILVTSLIAQLCLIRVRPPNQLNLRDSNIVV